MDGMFIAFLVLGFIVICCVFCWRSSTHNRKIAEESYSDSPIERMVALILGDLFPKVRDDLILRKNLGENFFERHKNALGNAENWM